MDGEQDSDARLFAIVSGRAPEARAAEAELYRRHVRYLHGVLDRQRSRLVRLSGLSPEDLVQDTFARAFERASTYGADPDLDSERARRRTRAWLGRIAQNLIADAFGRFREVSATPYLDRVTAPAEEEAPDSAPDLRRVRSALAELTEREQDVLRVTALYFRAGGHQRLPNAVSAELAARWGITNDNVRAIRSRALGKLRRAMEHAEPRELPR